VSPPNPIYFLETDNKDEVHDEEPIEPNNDESTSSTQFASSFQSGLASSHHNQKN
jgi:hypothetical protein